MATWRKPRIKNWFIYNHFLIRPIRDSVHFLKMTKKVTVTSVDNERYNTDVPN